MKILILSPDTRPYTGVGNATMRLCETLEKEFDVSQLTLVSDTFDTITNQSQVYRVKLTNITKSFPFYNAADAITLRGNRIYKELINKVALQNYNKVIVIGHQTWCFDILRFFPSEVLNNTMVFSHGTSTQVKTDFMSDFKNLRWIGYNRHSQKILKQIRSLVVLDSNGVGNRFSDIEMAKKSNIPVYELPNVGFKHTKFHQKRFLLSVSGFNKTKNPLFLIKTIPRNFPYKLRILGASGNNYYKYCQNLIARRKLENVQLIHGLNAAQVYKHYQGASLSLVSSKTECQPLSILDGQSLGIPYVALSMDSLKSLPGGILSTKRDYWHTCKTLLQNNEMYDRLSRIAVTNYRNRHSQNAYKRNLEKILHE